MDKKTVLKILAVMIVIGILFALFADRTSESSPTVDENLEGNMTDETRQFNNEIADDEKPRSIAFDHTNPGVSSEIYYTVGNLEPGTTFRASLYKRYDSMADYADSRDDTKTVTVDEFGVARFVWEITSFGDYGVSDQEWGYDMIMETVMVN